MNIITEGHSFGDAVRQIIQLFFNLNSELDVYSAIETNDCGVRAYTKIICNGIQYDAYESFEGTPVRREMSDLIKKSVFKTCRKISAMPAPWGISTGIRPAKTARQMLDEGVADEEIIAFMENEQWISPEKAELSLKVAKSERKTLSGIKKNGVSLYVGIPFCPSRCAYCSFISQAVKHNEKFVVPYADALLLEMRHCGEIVKKLGLEVETVYFGGGTPTAIAPDLLGKLIDGVKHEFDLSACREFTVEAGRPDTFSEEMLETLAKKGVDRISINPQTMHQKTLDAIGRRHSVEDTVRAFEMAHKFNKFSINADLIAGLPDETAEDFKETLRTLCALSPDAVTVHTMYMKRAAKLIDDFEKYRFAAGVNQMCDFALNFLGEKGYMPYYMYKQKNTLGNLENVGYAKKGHESLYNVYIMEEVQSIIAMGGGASSKIVMGDRIERIFNPKDAADYINRIDEIKAKKNIILDYLGGAM